MVRARAGRAEEPEPDAVEPEPAPEPAPEPLPDPVVVHHEPEPVAAEPEREPVGILPEQAQAVLDATLDNLGAAHHRPFSRG